MVTKPRYMLDSDICIDFQRRREQVVARLRSLKDGEALLSVVAYGELRFGVEKSGNPERARDALDLVIAAFPVATPSAEVGTHYGSIRAELERRGEVIGANDLWIAAHARALGLTLVTGNERAFRRVPDLKVENWAAA